MTELRAAVADLRRQDERRARVADALLKATDAGIKQVELVKETGFTREHVRRLVNEARDRRAKATQT
jgi:DNA-binding transcriptional regulator LsrR (DeoR family)